MFHLTQNNPKKTPKYYPHNTDANATLLIGFLGLKGKTTLFLSQARIKSTFLVLGIALGVSALINYEHFLSLEDRVYVIEQRVIDLENQQMDFRDTLFQVTANQDDATAFQNRTEKKLNNVNDKVNKFYAFVKNRTIIVV